MACLAEFLADRLQTGLASDDGRIGVDLAQQRGHPAHLGRRVGEWRRGRFHRRTCRTLHIVHRPIHFLLDGAFHRDFLGGITARGDDLAQQRRRVRRLRAGSTERPCVYASEGSPAARRRMSFTSAYPTRAPIPASRASRHNCGARRRTPGDRARQSRPGVGTQPGFLPFLRQRRGDQDFGRPRPQHLTRHSHRLRDIGFMGRHQIVDELRLAAQAGAHHLRDRRQNGPRHRHVARFPVARRDDQADRAE